jgi:tRNA/tmRNA/rRNA uracil-C5-methylase (TrmA/RlmC/RlmD family)
MKNSTVMTANGPRKVAEAVCGTGGVACVAAVAEVRRFGMEMRKQADADADFNRRE